MATYIAAATVFDQKSKHTIVEGEDCTLEKIMTNQNKSIAVLKNSQNNILKIPLALFENWFNKRLNF